MIQRATKSILDYQHAAIPNKEHGNISNSYNNNRTSDNTTNINIIIPEDGWIIGNSDACLQIQEKWGIRALF